MSEAVCHDVNPRSCVKAAGTGMNSVCSMASKAAGTCTGWKAICFKQPVLHGQLLQHTVVIGFIPVF